MSSTTWTASQFLPIVGWLPDCTSKSVRTDLVAGIALAGRARGNGICGNRRRAAAKVKTDTFDSRARITCPLA
jgi:hypothetical protein